jgi:hypothetical protein
MLAGFALLLHSFGNSVRLHIVCNRPSNDIFNIKIIWILAVKITLEVRFSTYIGKLYCRVHLYWIFKVVQEELNLLRQI